LTHKGKKMGCFSFLCKECGKGIESTSFDGQKCRLYWLKEGKVHQEMKGAYDSYGTCFNEQLDGSHQWKDAEDNDAWPEPMGDIKFNASDKYCLTGMAAVHEKCFKYIPSTCSLHDPNQGWGDDGELMGDCSVGGFEG
jgi:hypothetical protein